MTPPSYFFFIFLFFLIGLVSIGLFFSFRLKRKYLQEIKSLCQRINNLKELIEDLGKRQGPLTETVSLSANYFESTSSTLEELASMVTLNSEHAKQAASLSHDSRDAAQQGEEEIRHLITAINDISTSSKEIEQIISVIDDIAFQTNLLALNAAVEAARAGEQGRGFAVVADAVRSLAQRSSVAAKDISNLIAQSSAKVEVGKVLADSNGEILGNIVTSAKRVSDLNDEMAITSNEHVRSIQDLAKATHETHERTQNSRSILDEISKILHEIEQKLKAVPPPATSKKKQPQVGLKKQKSKPTQKNPKAIQVSFMPMPNPKDSPRTGADLIPFDEDSPRGKIGTTEGF